MSNFLKDIVLCLIHNDMYLTTKWFCRNCILMEMVKSIMSHSFFPISFWMYALKIAIYFLNRVPSKVVSKVPSEQWIEKKPNLRHLHVWDCLAKVRIYNLHEKKLDF